MRELEAGCERSKQSIPAWCEENGVEEDALYRLVETYGAHPNSRAVAICAFQIGYDARKRVEAEAAASTPRVQTSRRSESALGRPPVTGRRPR